MRYAPRWAAAAASIVFTGAFAVGCDSPEEDVQELPEVVQEEPASGTQPRQLDKEITLGPEDVGELILANGWVEGQPLESGFFLRTEFNRLIFVQTDHSVQPGDPVSVRGRVEGADEVQFPRWADDALGRDRDWDLWTDIFLRAEEVKPFEGALDEPDDDEVAPPAERRP